MTNLSNEQLNNGLQIAVIDTQVADYQVLQQSAEQAGMEVILLAAGEGLSEVATALKGRSGIEALHVLTHGNDGSINLASGPINSQTLDKNQTPLDKIAESLTSKANILLYACNVAQSALGKAFVDKLAHLTGANVAASTTLIGAEDQGGNWVLDYHTGSIQTQSIRCSSYAGVLVSVPTWTRYQFSTTVTPYDIGVGDINADGRIDFAFAEGNTTIGLQIQYQQADGSFTATDYDTANTDTYTYTTELADFDGNIDSNAQLDVITGGMYNTNSNQLFVNTGSSFTENAAPQPNSRYQDYMIADYNNDGLPDFAVYDNSAAKTKVYLNTTTTANTLTFTFYYETPTGTYSLGGDHNTIGDFNGDGKVQYLRQKSRRFGMNSTEFGGLEDFIIH